ncbi:hypothetical protein D3C87_2094760 [compost metagenome]
MDWYTSAIVTFAVPPFSSVSMMVLPLALAVSVPPATVLMLAMPLPSAIIFDKAAASHLPATTW